MFDKLDVLLAMAWGWASFLWIGHRTPWGFWDTRQRNWYRNALRVVRIGFSGSFYGVTWIFSHLAIAAVGFMFFREYTEESAGISISLLILLNCGMALEKMWAAVFFDYRNYIGALVISILLFLFTAPVPILIGITAVNVLSPTVAWIAMGLSIAVLCWYTALVVISAAWLNALGTAVIIPRKNFFL